MGECEGVVGREGVGVVEGGRECMWLVGWLGGLARERDSVYMWRFMYTPLAREED